MRFALFALLAPLTLAACGDDDTSPDGGGGSDEGGAAAGGAPEGGAGGGAACPAGSHDEGGVCTAALVGWAEGPELNRARDHHVTFIAETPAGPFLYVAAGASASGLPLRSVERATIAEDGTLGAFEEQAQLPAGLVGPGLGQVDRGIVIAGGLANTGASTGDVVVGRVEDDGTVTFTAGPALAVPRYHVGVVAHGGFVYAIGGMVQTVDPLMQTVSPDIERATFDGETLGDWEPLDPLDLATTHHAVFSYGDSIYVVGGGSSLEARTEILRSVVDGSGNLGPWEPAGELSEGRATSSTTVFLDHLYVFAGMTTLSGDEQSTVLGAPLVDGVPGAFEALEALPMARAHAHQTPIHNGFFYSVGGSIDHEGQAQTFIGDLE